MLCSSFLTPVLTFFYSDIDSAKNLTPPYYQTYTMSLGECLQYFSTVMYSLTLHVPGLLTQCRQN